MINTKSDSEPYPEKEKQHMGEFAAGYMTEKIVKDRELLFALKNYEKEYGEQALDSLLEEVKNRQSKIDNGGHHESICY